MTSIDSYCPETHVLIGEVIKAQGLRGELKIYCYSGQPENLRNYSKLALAGKKGTISPELVLEGVRAQGSSAIVQLKTISDRSQAEQYVGYKVLVAKEDLPAPQQGEFYWLDFQGKNAVLADGNKLGKITQLFSNGAHDVLVISDGQSEYLVPVIDGIVKSVTKDTVMIEPPPGLLEINLSLEG